MTSNAKRLGMLAFAAAQAVGCGGTPEGTWATQLLDADAWVAVTVEGGHAVAFVCGGADNLSISRWMAEPADDSVEFELDGVKLSLDLNDEQATGSLIDPNGVALNVSANRIDGGDLAGLYTSMDAGGRDGLIILPTASGDFDALGAWRHVNGELAQVTPVRPLFLEQAGLPVTADPVAGTRSFFMNLVVAAEVQQ